MHSPTLGKADAPVVIVEFLDPACETCRAFYPRVKEDDGGESGQDSRGCSATRPSITDPT
ncbi:thioredoxin domain-containing protein [Aromatoleum toluvorans]|uniref:Thioredoxin domain-containing protein n=2 Tax=Aromatoleum toluvorans TaxID=92002 RepID=A0ABX1PS12_9RHOO|nr:thioredoxin domain-containing protein [Aromatoleum toluvorans]NMG42229.1 thioredoxin domain-containing protein [Aromatoleum toluvorans]